MVAELKIKHSGNGTTTYDVTSVKQLCPAVFETG